MKEKWGMWAGRKRRGGTVWILEIGGIISLSFFPHLCPCHHVVRWDEEQKQTTKKYMQRELLFLFPLLLFLFNRSPWQPLQGWREWCGWSNWTNSGAVAATGEDYKQGNPMTPGQRRKWCYVQDDTTSKSEKAILPGVHPEQIRLWLSTLKMLKSVPTQIRFSAQFSTTNLGIYPLLHRLMPVDSQER